MTVKELIEALQSEDQNAEVKFAYPSGDYWRTTLLGSIESVSEEDSIHSDYHDKDQLVTDPDDVSESDELKIKRVVVLQ